MSIFHWKQDFAASSGRCPNTRHQNFWQNWIGLKNLPAGYYRDLQTSGQNMCSNGSFAIETSIKNLILSKTKNSCSPFYWCLLSQVYATPNRPGGLPVCALPPGHEVSGGRGTGDDVFEAVHKSQGAPYSQCIRIFRLRTQLGPHLCMSLQHVSFSLLLQWSILTCTGTMDFCNTGTCLASCVDRHVLQVQSIIKQNLE